MQYFSKLICAFLFLSIFALETNAQKIGYLNSGNLIVSMPAAKSADQNLQNLQKQFQTELANKEKALTNRLTTVQKQIQAGTMAPAEQERAQQEIQQENLKLQQAAAKMEQDLMKKRESLMKPIIDKINSAIEAVAKENGYDMIFEGSAGILYAEQAQDVTALVKKKLGI